jgi:hypothetical protein
MLRVWVATRWYTHGIDPQLTTRGDTWELDLGNKNVSLPVGIYTITVEVETDDGLLLRNVDAGSFAVFANAQVSDEVVPSTAPLLSHSGFIFSPTPVVGPEEAEVSDEPVAVILPSSINDARASAHRQPSSDPLATLRVAGIVAVVAVGAGLMYVHSRRR